MGSKLYVGNLSYQTGEDELKLAFAQCGTVVEAKVISDRESGRSRGFGFVTMSSDQEAQEAIRVWSGKALSGRPLTVNEAQERQGGPRPAPRTQSFGGGQQGGGGGGGGGDRGRRGGGRDRGRGRDRDRDRDWG